MSDIICRKTMQRCQTPGMCAPFGGCLPSILKEQDVCYSSHSPENNSNYLALLRAGFKHACEQRDKLLEEKKQLHGQIAALQSSPDSWQSAYDKGRVDGTKTRLSELEQERRINAELRTRADLLLDALQHIVKTCQRSRTSTRRLRWIGKRAQWALEGKPYDDSAFDLPKDAGETQEKLSLEVKQLRGLLRESQARPDDGSTPKDTFD